MIKERAYAKINLFLDVISKREDGFHNINSIMHSVSLSDELFFEILPCEKTEIVLEIEGNSSIPDNEDNLIVKAAKEFLKEANEKARIEVYLKKNIPVCAGLGGGSSDAAATLRALNNYYNKFSEEELLSIASRLGSDVPFCLVGGTAFCQGRGEILNKIENCPDLSLVISIGRDKVSTPEAYRKIDQLYLNENFDKKTDEKFIKEVVERIYKVDFSSEYFYNVFEKIVPFDSSVNSIKTSLLGAGARFCLMSGSGPSVFGLFEDDNSALRAVDILRSCGYTAYFAKSI